MSASKPHHVRRLVAKYSRWLHVYGSMTSFALVFFFAATGITLNHPQWFASAQRTKTLTGTMDVAWLAGASAADLKQLAIVEHLRSTQHLTGAVTEFGADDRECDVTFKGPGYSADAVIDRASGRYEVTETRMGLGALFNDLHKGRDTGGAWKLFIDVSASLLVFVSLTGLVLIWFIHKHRFAGLLLLGAGAVVSYVIYAIWVP